MPFQSYEQPSNGMRTHVATWQSARGGAEWLKDRSQQLEVPDLFLANPVVRAHFAESSLANGEAVTWTVNSSAGRISLTVEPS